jgi:hypothetical protein
MSSVVISGDTSGSITLSAPAVAGTNTITLPAATGTVAVTGNIPTFRVGKTDSAQSIATGTFTKVTFNSETFDTNSNFASSTFTPTVAGYYQFNANALFNTITSGQVVIIAIYKNGAAYTRGSGGYLNNTSGDIELTVSALIQANGSTDYFDVYVYQNSGGNRDIFNSEVLTSFSGCLVRNA